MHLLTEIMRRFEGGNNANIFRNIILIGSKVFLKHNMKKGSTFVLPLQISIQDFYPQPPAAAQAEHASSNSNAQLNWNPKS